MGSPGPAFRRGDFHRRNTRLSSRSDQKCGHVPYPGAMMSFADDFLEDHDPRTWVTPSGQAQDGSDLPGVRNAGLLATQELAHGVPERADWEAACQASKPSLTLAGQRLVERLGVWGGTLSTAASVLTAHDAKRAVAVFLDESETFEDLSARFGATPVSHGLALADREGLPWLVR